MKYIEYGKVIAYLKNEKIKLSNLRNMTKSDECKSLIIETQELLIDSIIHEICYGEYHILDTEQRSQSEILNEISRYMKMKDENVPGNWIDIALEELDWVLGNPHRKGHP